MSFKKYANAILTDPILKNADWQKMWGQHAFKGCRIDRDHPFCKTAADQSRYILSHCTIMSSVAVEEKPFDYLIRPCSAAFVNNNDDAWSSTVLKLSYQSFRGAFSFVEHFQNSKFAKGVIFDSVLRKISLTPKEGDWIYYCDILVGTDLTHEKLVEDIRSKKIRYLSMGCVTDEVQCSYCGTRVTDSNNYCHHLQFLKGTFQVDNDGVPRRVAELCGRDTLPNGGVKFVEASWVSQPAFPGSVKRSVVSDNWLGPATPYTQVVSKEARLKVASVNNLGEYLMLQDD